MGIFLWLGGRSKSDVYTKPQKSNYTEAKAYPISLSSFILKTMEKLPDRNIRDGIFKDNHLHQTVQEELQTALGISSSGVIRHTCLLTLIKQ
jgi:hypothetical protein